MQVHGIARALGIVSPQQHYGSSTLGYVGARASSVHTWKWGVATGFKVDCRYMHGFRAQGLVT